MTPWPTPTPLVNPSLTMTPVLSMPAGDGLVDGLIQGYNTINAHGLFNFFWLMVLVLILIMGLWLAIRKIQDL